MTATGRRFGAKDSATRAALVQAGIAVLETEGAANFTSKRVAQQAGLKPQLVYYYFRTIEDLVIAICEEAGEQGIRRAVEAVSGEEPLRGLWRVTNEERSAVLVGEVQSLAHNSPAIRAVTIRMLERYRREIGKLVDERLGKRDTGVATGTTIVMICDALSRLLSSERALDFDVGHDELVRGIETWLEQAYGPPADTRLVQSGAAR
jgi:TetR/AcrR family transcriptional regulator